MKVKVVYIGRVETEIEVDDKFKETLPAWEDGNDDLFDKLSDELIAVVLPQIDGDLSQIFDGTGQLICEM